jgi:stage V sporulation protein AF
VAFLVAPTDDQTVAEPSKQKSGGGKRNYGHDARLDQKKLNNDELQEKEEIVQEEQISKKLLENKKMIIERLGVGTSFDVVFRELVYGEKEIGMVYVNGFAKDLALIPVMNRLSMLDREQLVPDTMKHLLQTFIPHMQVEIVENMNEVANKVLAGSTAFFVEREEKALIVDAKSFPSRNPEEPDTEGVVRGSKDGFIETILMNTALTRRRIRDQRLRIEILQVGERSKTDVAVAYLKDIADPTLIQEIKQKLDAIEVDGLPMADTQVEEMIIKKGWNPYPLVRYTERPDVAAAHILEGHILVFVDTSPSAMILPTTYFHHVQHAEEYRHNPTVGNYLRWVRFIGIFGSIFLIPTWMLFVMQPELLPEALDFIGPAKEGKIPIFVQFIFAELGVDLMRMAAIHTPTPIATAMGLVAAVLIGQIAIDVGLFVPEVILYTAVATIGTFATPSYELSLANRLVRLVLLVAAYTMGIPGLVGGITLWIIMLATTQSFKSPYFWPFIPFNAKAMLNILFRSPLTLSKIRPSITQPQQKRRQPKS